jgi:hypothetical protein
MQKNKRMFNMRNQANYEESYITKCQYLLNQDMKWLVNYKWKLIIRCEVLQVTTYKKSYQSKIKYDNPREVKGNEVTRLNFVQAQVEGVIFIFKQNLNAHIA